MVENFVEYRCFVLFDVDLDFGSSLVEEYYRRVQHYRHPFFEIHNTVDSAEREFVEWRAGRKGVDYQVSEVVHINVVDTHEVLKKYSNVEAVGRFRPFAEHFI